MKRKSGRPPLACDDPSVSVTVKFPSREFDAMCVRAIRCALSVPELIRRELRNKKLQTRPPR